MAISIHEFIIKSLIKYSFENLIFYNEVLLSSIYLVFCDHNR